MRARVGVFQDVRKAAQPTIARRGGTTRRRSTTTTSRVWAGRRRPATPDEAASWGRGTVGRTPTAPGPGRRRRETGCLATGFTTAVRLDAVCATLGVTCRHSTDDASRVSCCVGLTLSSTFPAGRFPAGQLHSELLKRQNLLVISIRPKSLRVGQFLPHAEQCE